MMLNVEKSKEMLVLTVVLGTTITSQHAGVLLLLLLNFFLSTK